MRMISACFKMHEIVYEGIACNYVFFPVYWERFTTYYLLGNDPQWLKIWTKNASHFLPWKPSTWSLQVRVLFMLWWTTIPALVVQCTNVPMSISQKVYTFLSSWSNTLHRTKFIYTACPDELFNELRNHLVSKFIKTLKEINMAFLPLEAHV